MQFLAVILAQFGLSIMGFHMGKQFLAVVDNYLPLVTKRILQGVGAHLNDIGCCSCGDNLYFNWG